MVMFCPSLRPCSRKPCRKFSIHIGGGGPIRRKPIRLTLPGCCARAMSGHAAAALPRRVMNSRLLTRAPHMHDADIRLSDLRSRGAPRLLRCSEPSPAMTVVGHLRTKFEVLIKLVCGLLLPHKPTFSPSNRGAPADGGRGATWLHEMEIVGEFAWLGLHA